jgi:hypothetical protein
MYSCGGYVVSLPTVNVPGVIRSLGAAIVVVAGLGVEPLPVVLVLLPQAGSNIANKINIPTHSIPFEAPLLLFWRE